MFIVKNNQYYNKYISLIIEINIPYHYTHFESTNIITKVNPQHLHGLLQNIITTIQNICMIFYDSQMIGGIGLLI